jgi:putative ATP-dependent endonuclease of OLD family
VLLTCDQDYLRVQEEDFHVDAGGKTARQITLRCKLTDLGLEDQAAFVEHLTYEAGQTALYIHWRARRLSEDPGSRRWVDVSVHSGKNGGGPVLEGTTRQLLAAAYLKPLRDAERELSPGRGSRLSQILGSLKTLEAGEPFKAEDQPKDLGEIEKLSLVGLFDFMRTQMVERPAIRQAQKDITDRHLRPLTLKGDDLQGRIRFTEDVSPDIRLRRLLERLELGLYGPDDKPRGSFGLGSNNLLFMACELLLLGRDTEGMPLLLVEEPEAHLHPQRQLRLMQFLEKAAKGSLEGQAKPVQVILTTHSPNLASQIPVANLVMLKGGKAYPLRPDQTCLDAGDFRFLERFLDVTKANLFFARGVLIVEGDAEAILLPALARLIGRDLTERGVSIVNVGGTGLRRFARIFQRTDEAETGMGIPVASITDMDVMPDCAPGILELTDSKTRRWKKHSDFGVDEPQQEVALEARRAKLCEGDGQGVQTFVADHWTLEYDLSVMGLDQEVFQAAWLAKNEDPLNENRKDRIRVLAEAAREWIAIMAAHPNAVERSVHIYSLFRSKQASKAIAAQHLAVLLEEAYGTRKDDLLLKLPSYLKEALAHVTGEALEAPKAIPVFATAGLEDES